jgi:flagellar biosynthesis protein FlhG
MAEKPIIVPVAGGKGGVGKTFLTANLGLALAGMGHSTVVVDLDLGNSNLHSLLGMPNKFPGIGDFLRVGEGSLENFLVDTPYENLRFLSGDGRMPFMANITHSQKIQLIQKIRLLPADYVLLDLGAGCAYHTLDFFAMVERGLVVSTPEYPAIMSALVFLKNLVLREIERSMPKDSDLTDFLQELYVQPMDAPQLTVGAFYDRVSRANAEAGEKIRGVVQRCRPRLIYNMGEHPDDLKWAGTIERTVEQVLSIELDHFGFVYADPSVKSSIREGKAFLPIHAENQVARNIQQIARRIVKFWHQTIPNSAELLQKRTREEQEKSLVATKAPPEKEDARAAGQSS